MNRLLTKSAATMLALLLVLTASVQVRAQETSNQAGATTTVASGDLVLSCCQGMRRRPSLAGR